MTRRPRVLVTLDTGTALRRGVPLPNLQLKAAYAESVERAGGLPLLVAPTADVGLREELGALMDALVITGGDFDIEPWRYGHGGEPPSRLDTPKPLRTDFEWHLLEQALERRVPVLGICGGMQLLNVVLGGTLLGDIGSERPDALQHEQPTSPTTPDHPVEVVPGTALEALAGALTLQVNTTHHQAVDRLGRGLEVWGRSPDGIVEAIGLRDRPEVVGVQWHPELLDDGPSRALYGALVRACARR
jgi:putative glutamine amidotransferase